MKYESVELRKGIVSFKGKLSRNLMFEPIVSHSYFFEDNDEVFIFDPSCGKKIAKAVEKYIQSRLKTKPKWKKAFVIAGHSHFDHANNFYLCETANAPEKHIYVHESGFQDGRVKNEPTPFIQNVVDETRKYYNPYLAYPFPYNFLMFPLAVINAFSPASARKLFSLIGSIPFPDPANGTLMPEPLRDNDLQSMDFEGPDIKAWKVGSKLILPTPGHSDCSVSLFWPEQKALCVSDADWFGNPVFSSSSLKDCISSLEKIKALTSAGKIDLLLPAHGLVKEGTEQILSHLDFHIRRLEVIRNEVLTAYRASGEIKNVRKLTKILTRESPLFKSMKLTNYPRLVVFAHNMVAVCLREEGILN